MDLLFERIGAFLDLRVDDFNLRLHGLDFTLEQPFFLVVGVDVRESLLNLCANGSCHLLWTSVSEERMASSFANLAFLEVGILLVDGNAADAVPELGDIRSKILSKLDCIELPDRLIFFGPVVNVETDELLPAFFAQ